MPPDSGSLTHRILGQPPEFGLSKSFLLNENSNCLRATCRNGNYFVALQTQCFDGSHEPFAIGIVSSEIDFNSLEVTETALQIITTLHIAIRMSFKLREEKIINANRIAAAKLASQVAHDIRSPLTALATAFQSVENVPEENKILMNSAINRIKLIANDMLKKSKDLSRKNEDPVSSNDRDDIFDLSGPLDEIIREKISTHNRHKIIHSVQKNLQSIGNKLEFQRVVSNVIDNAIYATLSKEVPSVGVCAKKLGNSILVSIQDNGIGIPDHIVSQLGKRGFSFGKEEGNGLGLSHAFETIGAWGGKVNIFSKENEGTIIQLQMQIAPAVQPLPQP